MLFIAKQEYIHAGLYAGRPSELRAHVQYYQTMAIVFLIGGILFLIWSFRFRRNKKSGG